LLASRRGVGGGYSFRVSPESLTVGSVIEAIEGSLAPLPCASEAAADRCSCDNPAACPIRPLVVELGRAISAVLGGKTIADLARSSPGDDALHYEI
jgi:DNA-binding IscR family transcriptional regulator